MIKTFRCKETERLYSERLSSKRFRSFADTAYRKLIQLDEAGQLRDLQGIPGNRLEKLRAIVGGSTASGLISSGGFASDGSRETAMTLKLLTTTRKKGRAPRKISPVHPGEILREDVLKPLGMSVNKLALSLAVPATRMAEIVNGRRAITPDTALRLARFLGTTPEFWVRLQSRYELELAKEKFSATIERTVRPYEAMA